MLYLVLGFKGMDKEADVVTVYAGYDGTEAQKALTEKPPAGVKRTEWFVRPQCSKRRVFLTDAEVSKQKAAEAAAEQKRLDAEAKAAAKVAAAAQKKAEEAAAKAAEAQAAAETKPADKGTDKGDSKPEAKPSK